MTFFFMLFPFFAIRLLRYLSVGRFSIPFHDFDSVKFFVSLLTQLINVKQLLL
jgi:hypothetical protein